VNIHQLMDKFSSKRELYNFLSQECHAYLPKMETINIYYLKQIVRAEKDVIHISLTCIVYQTIECEGCSCTIDWWSYSRRHHWVFKEEESWIEILTRSKGLEPYRQKMVMWCYVYLRWCIVLSIYWQSIILQEGETREELKPLSWNETRVCKSSRSLYEL
jgi:hypothetical protein